MHSPVGAVAVWSLYNLHLYITTYARKAEYADDRGCAEAGGRGRDA